MQLYEAVSLEREERDHLVRIIESSLRVKERHQFFVWSQGALQALLPHEILVCGVDLSGSGEIELHHFSSCMDFHDEHFEAVCKPGHGLIPRMMRYWRKNGSPCLISPIHATPGCGTELVPLLERHKLQNLAAHGISSPGGGIRAYFCFSRVEHPFGARLEHILELLVPYLHVTLARVLAGELGVVAEAQAPANRVTVREAEILQWIRDGKTNGDIAVILDLSPLTVKNHVQKVLKKLGVSNRSQAVARAITLGLIKSSHP